MTHFYHLRQLRCIWRSLDADSAVTVVHAFMTSLVDHCNAVLSVAPKTTTDRLQWVLNNAARVVSDTKKFDQGLSWLMHQELHSLHGGIYAPLHVISWPYLDIVSALTVSGQLLSLVQQCSTLCQMIYEILQLARQHSDNNWIRIFLCLSACLAH